MIMTKYMAWIFPLVVLLGIAPFSADLDLAVSNYFFSDGQFVSNRYISLFYNNGEYISLFVAMMCGAVGVYTLMTKRCTFLTKGAFVAAITFVIGAGLFTNVILKNIWGRPRPRQIEQFGGTQTFRPFYQPNPGGTSQAEKLKSFPSGHAATGFFFLVFAAIGLRERNRLLTWLGLIFGLAWGINLSVIRIMQGGHFLSDTLGAAAIMWWTALAVTYVVYDKSWLKNWS